MQPQDERLTVLHLPDYTETNPYQSNLIKALRKNGVRAYLETPDEPIIFSVIRATQQIEPDIIHLHWLAKFYRGSNIAETALKSFLFLLELLFLRLMGYTIVWTIHNLSPHDSDSQFHQIYYSIVARFVSHIIVHSQSGAETVSDTYHFSGRTYPKVEVIPHGHYISNYKNEYNKKSARKELGIDLDRPTFVYVGLIRPYKNTTGLIDAFSNLKQDGSDAQLVIAGKPSDDDYKSVVRDRLQSVDSGQITYHQKFIPSNELQVYINAADAVVLPFKQSLTSGSAILALSFERPVIIPRRGCLIDLDPGAVYYDPSTETVLTGMEKALDADLEALGTAGRKLVSDYDWETIGRKTCSVYE